MIWFQDFCPVGSPTCPWPVQLCCYNHLSCCLLWGRPSLFSNKHDFSLSKVKHKKTSLLWLLPNFCINEPKVLSLSHFNICFYIQNFPHFVLFKFAFKIFTGKVWSGNTNSKDWKYVWVASNQNVSYHNRGQKIDTSKHKYWLLVPKLVIQFKSLLKVV